jgi:hypothetical protein
VIADNILASSRAASRNRGDFLLLFVALGLFAFFFVIFLFLICGASGNEKVLVNDQVALDVHNAVDHTYLSTHSSACLCGIPKSLTVIHPDCTNVDIGIPQTVSNEAQRSS